MITLIIFYLLLIAISFLIFRNAKIMWKMSNDFTLLISTVIIFYFSLGGAFVYPLDAFLGFKGGSIGMTYLPIFEKLFIVNFDTDYFITCSYYVLFILVFQYSYIFIVNSIIRKNLISKDDISDVKYEIVINPYLVGALSLVFIFISFYILRNEIFSAILNKHSIYLTTRANVNPNYTIHQLANEFCVLIPFIAYSFTMFKPDKVNIRIANKKGAIQILFFSCLLSSIYISFLGNRREILSGIVVFILICYNQLKYINYKRFYVLLISIFILFFSNNFFRSKVISSQINKLFHLEQSNQNEEDEKLIKKNGFDFKGMFGTIVFSNELFYAHFSMYGIVHQKIPLTYGSSYVYLAKSVVPRFISPNRPSDIYGYYATSINARKGQIYTIHHASACYLNFGLLGLIFGSFVIALFFIFAFVINLYRFKKYNTFLIYLKFMLSYLICSQLVTFITAGPEAYKSIVIEGIIFPLILLTICSKKNILVYSNNVS